MKQRFSCLASLGFLAVSTVAFANFQPLPDLGVGGGAYDVNATGEIVGAVVEPVTFALLPATWKNGALTLLSVPTNASGFARRVSSNGIVVGSLFATAGTATEPALWRNGVLERLPTLGEGGSALDVNATGTVVGFVFRGDDRLPAVWRNGQLRLLPTPTLGNPGDITFAAGESINDTGEIVGTKLVAFASSDSIALRWTADLLRPLDLSNLLESRGVFVADDGSVLISAYEGPLFDGRRNYFVRPNGTRELLVDVANANQNVVTGATDAGLALGFAARFDQTNGIPTLQPVYWERGIPTELELPTPNRWGFPLGANASGVIVGYLSDGQTGYSIPGTWEVSTGVPGLDLNRPTGMPGQTVTLESNYRPNGQPQAGVTVRFLVGPSEVGKAVTDVNGRARVNYPIPSTSPAGPKEIMASLGGSRYTRSVLEVLPIPTLATGVPTRASAGATASLGGSVRNRLTQRPLPGQPVRVQVLGTSRTVMTDGRGAFRLAMAMPRWLRPGQRVSVTIKFPGNHNHLPSTANTFIVIR